MANLKKTKLAEGDDLRWGVVFAIKSGSFNFFFFFSNRKKINTVATIMLTHLRICLVSLKDKVKQ